MDTDTFLKVAKNFKSRLSTWDHIFHLLAALCLTYLCTEVHARPTASLGSILSLFKLGLGAVLLAGLYYMAYHERNERAFQQALDLQLKFDRELQAAKEDALRDTWTSGLSFLKERGWLGCMLDNESEVKKNAVMADAIVVKLGSSKETSYVFFVTGTPKIVERNKKRSIQNYLDGSETVVANPMIFDDIYHFQDYVHIRVRHIFDAIDHLDLHQKKNYKLGKLKAASSPPQAPPPVKPN